MVYFVFLTVFSFFFFLRLNDVLGERQQIYFSLLLVQESSFATLHPLHRSQK